MGYFAVRMIYEPTAVMGMGGDFVLSDSDSLHLVLVNDDIQRSGEQVDVRVLVKRLDGTQVDTTRLDASIDESGIVALGEYRPRFPEAGLYQIVYEVGPRD